MPIIDGVDVCGRCGQEVCDCGSELMHDMEPDKIESDDGFGEAEFWSILDRDIGDADVPY